MNLKEDTIYNTGYVYSKFRFNTKEADYHINRLLKLGFLTPSTAQNTYKLTNRAIFFKSYEFRNREIDIDPESKKLSLMHAFLNLDEIQPQGKSMII